MLRISHIECVVYFVVNSVSAQIDQIERWAVSSCHGLKITMISANVITMHDVAQREQEGPFRQLKQIAIDVPTTKLHTNGATAPVAVS